MLKDIADHYNFSCEHLSRLFRKKLGLTFMSTCTASA